MITETGCGIARLKQLYNPLIQVVRRIWSQHTQILTNFLRNLIVNQSIHTQKLVCKIWVMIDLTVLDVTLNKLRGLHEKQCCIDFPLPLYVTLLGQLGNVEFHRGQQQR